MENTFIPKAMEIVKQAVVADNADELEKALSLYKQGLGYFMTGLKYIKNDKSKIAIREKMATYMDRAEEIKVAIEKKIAPKKKLSKQEALPMIKNPLKNLTMTMKKKTLKLPSYSLHCRVR